MLFSQSARCAKFAVALTAALALAACAKNTADEAAGDLAGGRYGAAGRGGVASPGSSQDFVVNVGDRIFFETDFDRADLDRAGDARQAGGMAQSLFALQLHHGRPCRRARHARI